jgi:hypothetical protein
MERFEVYCRSGSFVKVNTITLCEAFCDVANFVMDNFSGVITFTFADEFALEGALATREFRSWHKNEYFEIFKTF